jgi:hypothetical protein
MFGVKLTLSSRDGFDEDSGSEDHAYDDDNDREEAHVPTVDSSPLSYSPTTPTATTNCVPFPSSQPQLEQGNGNTSYHERFVSLDKSGQARPRSISADNDGSSSADPSSGLVPGACYPTSFSSNLRASVCDTHSHMDPHGRRSSNHHLFDALSSQTQEHQERPRGLIADIPTAVDEQDMAVTPTVPSTAYPQHHQQPTLYFYSPPHDTTYFSPHYNPSSQASSASMHFPLPPSSPNFVFEHANPHNWTWMPAVPAGPMGMATNGPATPGFYIPSLSPVSAPHLGGMYYHVPPLSGEFHLSGNSSEGVEFNSTYRQTQFPRYSHYPEPPPSSSMFQEPSPNSHTPTTLASTRLSDSPEVVPPRLHESSPSQPNERNQLNLARIENGQDTRTTVMVKNIPNKMSDKDLIAYIGNVCPRRIDFLYLRMDFQNGEPF